MAAPPPPSEAELLAKEIVGATSGEPGSLDVKALYAEDCVSHEPRSEPAVGFEGLAQKDRYWRDLQKRSTWKARHVATVGSTILIEWEAEVELRDGRTVLLQEVAVHQVKNGKIAEEWYYYDPAVFEAPAVVEGDAPEPPAPRAAPPRTTARPAPVPGTPPVDPIDL